MWWVQMCASSHVDGQSDPKGTLDDTYWPHRGDLSETPRADICLFIVANVEEVILGLRPAKWETSLQSDAVSHWLGANLESTLQ